MLDEDAVEQLQQLQKSSFAEDQSEAGLQIALDTKLSKLQHSALHKPHQKDTSFGSSSTPQQVSSTSSNKKGKQKRQQPPMDTFRTNVGAALSQGDLVAQTESYHQEANVQGSEDSQSMAHGEELVQEDTVLDSLEGYFALSDVWAKELLMLPNFNGNQVSDKLSAYLQRKPRLTNISAHCASIWNSLQRLSQTKDAKKLNNTLGNVRMITEYIEGEQEILQLWFNIQTPENQNMLTSLLHQAQSYPQPAQSYPQPAQSYPQPTSQPPAHVNKHSSKRGGHQGRAKR